MPNRLARERSPYLLQHAANPVDWYPWGPEAFERARREDKPIFLSIGYSTCHWCHVMEHESFEDADVAAVLNREFVSIKVDREERPDVDRVYMTFVQATTGQGGWPMSVWLTPELKPFFGGTYFPPTSKWGRPGFVDILEQLARAWKNERDQVTSSADMVVDRLREAAAPDVEAQPDGVVAGREAIDAGIASFAQTFDVRRGGFGGAPKFPRPSELLFLLYAHAFTGDRNARTMAVETLRAMALGGMRDHVGGGFHRYSVDAEWRVPHFEKMLYDQAQLVLAYLDAFQATGDEFYAAVAEDTLDYVLRDLTASTGAFFSAEDADSEIPVSADADSARPHEKREGAFYVWTQGEIERLLGDDAAVVIRRFGVEPRGNALADPQAEFVNQNILYVAQSIDEIAARTGKPIDEVMAALARARQTLFTARASRPRPHLDDKILTAWNGLMIAAFARAARVLVDSPRRAAWGSAAERAAAWVRDTLWRPSTRPSASFRAGAGSSEPEPGAPSAERHLLRRFRDGEAAIDGFCEDYAYLVWGITELFQATGDLAWLEWARELTEEQTRLFYDERDGGWFSTTGADSSVLLRLKEDYDGAEPAAASVTVRNLIVLGHLTSEHSWLERAQRTLERYGAAIARAVRVMPLMASNLVLWHGGAPQVVVAGSADAPDTCALEAVIARRYIPAAVIIPLRSAAPREAVGPRLAWLAAMTARGGQATAYVCENFTCREPVTDPEALERQLTGLGQARKIIG